MMIYTYLIIFKVNSYCIFQSSNNHFPDDWTPFELVKGAPLSLLLGVSLTKFF